MLWHQLYLPLDAANGTTGKTQDNCKRHHFPEASKPPAAPLSTSRKQNKPQAILSSRSSKEETTLLAKQKAIAGKTESHAAGKQEAIAGKTVSHLPARDEEIESEESEEIESERLIDMRVLVKIIKYLFFVIVGLYAVALLGGPALLFHMM